VLKSMSQSPAGICGFGMSGQVETSRSAGAVSTSRKSLEAAPRAVLVVVRRPENRLKKRVLKATCPSRNW
jgi:hypothetical protein